MIALLIGFFSDDEPPLTVAAADDTRLTVAAADDTVRLTVDDETYELSREQALSLRAAVGDALERRLVLVRTVGQYRRDGSYAVTRRGADATGTGQVFESLGALRALFDALPGTFDVEDVGERGPTGSRRHLVVRHLTEHPRFDCRLRSRRPLRAEKDAEGGR